MSLQSSNFLYKYTCFEVVLNRHVQRHEFAARRKNRPRLRTIYTYNVASVEDLIIRHWQDDAASRHILFQYTCLGHSLLPHKCISARFVTMYWSSRLDETRMQKQIGRAHV